MAEYFGHWLKLGERLGASGAKLPKIFTVNWFRKDADGKFVWPGFGDNMRVMAWMLERVDGTGQGEEHVFGTTPRYEHLHWHGLDFSEAQYASVTSIDRDAWVAEMKLHEDLFEQLAHNLPPELPATKAKIEARLAA
jgi:phosphoenolpyruvate carboxykinase (GTP)